jgi:hypothetical protein
MATTKITSNVLADNAALNNLNAGASIAFTKPVSVSGNLTVDTNTLFVDSVNNRVGIGTTTLGTAKLVIRNDNDSANWLLQTQNDNGNTNSLFTQNGAGDFVWYGYRNGTAVGSPELSLHSNGNSFLNGGNVGIGTASPATKFHVSEGISRFDRSGVVFDITPNYTGLGNVALDVTTNNGIIFRTNNIDRAVISNTGSVGIGTISPTAGYTLDVVGAAKISGNILCNGSILYLNAQQVLTQGTNSLTLGAATYFTTINYGNASTTVHNFAAGNVGIGTTTPNEKLHIYDSVDAHLKIAGADTAGSIRKLSLERSTGGAEIHFNEDTRITQGLTLNTTNAAYPMSFQINGNTKMFVNTTGNVGIGTTSPTSKLHVSDGSSINGVFSTYWTSNDIILSADTGVSNAMRLVRASDTPTTRSSLNFVKSRGTLASPSALQENDLVGDLLFGGYGVGGIGYGGGLFAYADGNGGPGADCPIRLSFVAGSNSQDRQERLTVKSNGNIGIGTTTPSEKLTVSGNISATGNVTASNLVYTTGDQTIAGLKTFSNNIVGNGTANRLPNQLAVTSSDIITKGLADSRYTSRNERITDDNTFVQTTWEQFLDFDDQYNQDLTIAAASGGTTFGASPVFGDTWSASSVGVVSFSGNDLYAHRGVFLVRGPTANSQAFYIGINRTTTPYFLTNGISEFTSRIFINGADFATQGYFKIGPIPKGGTGGADTTLQGGLIFNPFLHPTNLVLGVNKSTTVTPFTFTTTAANVDFLDTGFNFTDLINKWVNITYKIDRTVGPTITIIITRENVVLFQASYNTATHPTISTWVRRVNLYISGASNEIGLQSGGFTYTAPNRSQLFIDYLHYKVTGTSAAPSNWNSLRF